jgi:hypothetical protein
VRNRSDTCSCGHLKEAHQHYRPGSDCGQCGAEECSRFRRRKADQGLAPGSTRRSRPPMATAEPSAGARQAEVLSGPVSGPAPVADTRPLQDEGRWDSEVRVGA